MGYIYQEMDNRDETNRTIVDWRIRNLGENIESGRLSVVLLSS